MNLVGVATLTREQRWYCPNCTETAVANVPHVDEGGGAGRFHFCRGLRGMLAPMIPCGTVCKVEAVEREDYVGRELVQVDGAGRPIMRVETTRDDGNDVLVFAPCAELRIDHE